jgi:molecular chaperone GrpE
MEDMEKPTQDKEKEENKEETKEGPEKRPGKHVKAQGPLKAVERLKLVEAELDKKTTEARKDHDRFLRKCAELENYKKRIEKEKRAYTEFANEELVRALLPIIDNLERAMEHSEEKKNTGGEALESLRSGLKLTLDELYSQLKNFGLVPVKAEGDRFDPSKHEAISHEETEGVEGDTVITELRKGFFFRDRLIRPALVIVSKRPEKAKKAENEAEEPENE